MHRQGIELGVIAPRRVLQLPEKRAEKEQRRIRFDGHNDFQAGSRGNVMSNLSQPPGERV